ncbi:O-antigen ligase family protein, partial [Natronospira sp.]|uniref:O-antigen ligase family protein n=1 Tax=Natronospira sp. TaxID=2024970 RepID=UPI0038735C76
MLRETREWWSGLGNVHRFFIVCLLISPMLLLLWRDGRNLTLLLAGLPGLWFGVRMGFLRFTNIDGHRWLWAVFAFLGVGIFTWAANAFVEGGIDRMARHYRLLFFLPFLITLIWARPPKRLIWASLGLAGIAIGIAALVELWQVGEGLNHRVAGDAHIMSYGIISAMIATAVAGAAWQYRQEKALALFLALGAALALVGVIGSGVRAGLLAVAGGIFVLAILFARNGDRRAAAVFLGGPAILLAAVVLVAQNGITQRIFEGFNEIERYAETEATMPPREAVAEPGCMDNATLLEATLASTGFRATALEQPRVIEEEGPCGAGVRYRFQPVTAEAVHEATARLYRSVHDQAEPTPARVHARGEGARIRVAGGDWQTVPRELSAIDLRPGLSAGQYIDIRIDAGGWLEWTPEALFPGEYRYPHVIGSMPKRLEMWRFAMIGFGEKPLFGHGTGAFRAVTGPWIERGLAAPIIEPYSHAHSEYLDSLATRGLGGIAALMLLLFVLIYLSLRRREGQPRSPDYPGIPMAAAWVALACAFITEAGLSMNLHVITIALFMALTLYLTDKTR